MSRNLTLMIVLVVAGIAALAVWAQMRDVDVADPPQASSAPVSAPPPVQVQPQATAPAIAPPAATPPQSPGNASGGEVLNYDDATVALQQYKATLPTMAYLGLVETCEGLALENSNPDGAGAFAINDAPDGRPGPYPQVNVGGRVVTLCFSDADFAAFGAQEDTIIADNQVAIEQLRTFVGNNFDDSEETDLLQILGEAEQHNFSRANARNQAYDAYKAAQ